MATDLLGTHRIISALLEIRRIAITRETQSRESVQRVDKLLLKASGQKILHALDESMDKISKQESKDAVRRTIIEHNRIFRQQVHELHRLYRVQKSLMAELDCQSHNFQSETEEMHEMVQGSRPNLRNSPSTSQTSQSARLGSGQYSDPQQVNEHSDLQECKPVTYLSLFSEESSRTEEAFHIERSADIYKSVEGEHWSASMDNDLDLKLSIGPSSHAMPFSRSRERNHSGQHR
ncbi:hypothetical protein PR202_ga14519 [Eleusine coracana subsp. coracana]|uniref:Uncharacterized protein n=1 Tax=Eleusine coracana subsp. coracana TaxID=191504 RepID=A0AAV5CGT6_ELECO|nr:hypothetical protein PR202_ga14519 [Eleusine coracana subsp. coracana]